MKRRKNGNKPLWVVEQEDLDEYKRRQALLHTKTMEFKAAASYIDLMNQALREKYKLPPKYELDLDTGYVKEVKDAEAASV